MSTDADSDALAPAIDTVEFVSRFLQLVKEGNEFGARCCFCDAGGNLKVGKEGWRTSCCCSQEINGNDAPGFYACWTDSTRDEAIAKLGNGAGLPEVKPIEQRPMKRLPFWGWPYLAKMPKAKVWIHELSGSVLCWRLLLPDRVHLGLIDGQSRSAESLGILAGRSCVLIPQASPGGRLRMSALASELQQAGHERVQWVDVTDGISTIEGDPLGWAKKRSKAYPKPGEAAQEPPGTPTEPEEPTIPDPSDSPPPIQPRPRRSNGQGGPVGVPQTPQENVAAYELRTRAEVLSTIIYRRASEVTLRATDWLWPGKIPLGEICVIQGDPGLGKSQITASLCAIITKGGLWPVSRERCPAGSVVILSAEDSPAKTIVPRLAAAGADLERVTILQAIKQEQSTRGFSLLADMAALDALIQEQDNPMMVIIDPISAYQDTVGPASRTHDSHKNTDVRSLLRPVSELVDRRNITMVLINHLTKGVGRAITRGQGNMAFVAGPRAVWQVSKDKDEPRKRLFLPVKNNLADDSEETGLSFSVEGVDLGFDAQGKAIKTSRILWNDERVTITADEAAGYETMSQEDRGSVTDASVFLKEALADGRVKVKEVERAAKDAGHSLSTLGRAKRSLGVLSEREGFGREAVYYWRLKDDAPSSSTSPPPDR